jgi:hypothetical protein
MAKKKLVIKDAIKKPGALRKTLDAKEGETIPADDLEAKPSDSKKTAQRKRFAAMLKGFKSKKGKK